MAYTGLKEAKCVMPSVIFREIELESSNWPFRVLFIKGQTITIIGCIETGLPYRPCIRFLLFLPPQHGAVIGYRVLLSLHSLDDAHEKRHRTVRV